MKFSDKQIEQMRSEIANPELMKKRIEEEKAISRMVRRTKRMFKKQGRDFNAEFETWKNK